MIKNVPDHEELRALAVRAYFVAWKEATSVFEWIEDSGVIAFEIKDGNVKPVASDVDSLSAEDSAKNIEKYEDVMQHKLRLIYSLIQHSQELALKSHICKVSPFLLLSGSDVKSWAKENIDFTECKTIDAGDLVKVITALGILEISSDFKRVIEEVRRGRNAIQHIGKHKHIKMIEPIQILCQQYNELLPGRNWLRDLHETEDDGLSEIFYQDTAMDNVMQQLSMLHRLTTKKTARKVLGMQEESTVYRCLECFNSCEYFDGGNAVAASIERKRGAMVAKCFLCDTTFELRKKTCKKCGCDVIFDSGDYRGSCCECG